MKILIYKRGRALNTGGHYRSALFCACSVLLVSGAMVSGAEARADVRFHPVSPYGDPLSGCFVKSFRSAHEKEGKYFQYKSQFDGMTGHQIPFGEYAVFVRCRAREGFKEVRLDRREQFEIIAMSGRSMFSDSPLTLSITIDRPKDLQSTWWIRLVGLYNHREYIDVFRIGSDEARLIDPAPGRYLVLVQSTSGFYCSRRVDIYESTLRWRFVPNSCSLQVDKQARVVPDQ